MTKLIKIENLNGKTKNNVAYGLELMYLDKLFNAKVLDEPQYRTMKKYLIKKYKIEKWKIKNFSKKIYWFSITYNAIILSLIRVVFDRERRIDVSSRSS